MIKDLPVVITIATIVEDPDTTLVSVWLPTEKRRFTQKEKQKRRITKRGVEMIVMNEDPLGEARIQKVRTNHQGAIQK